MSKGGNFVSEAVLYFKFCTPSTIKTQINVAPFRFLIDSTVRPLNDISEILLKYPRGKTKMN